MPTSSHARTIFLVLLLVAYATPLKQVEARSTAEAPTDPIAALATPLTLDGKLGDPGWKLATVYREFRTVHPNPGGKPSEPTVIYLAHDADTLYVAVRSSDHDFKQIRTGTAVEGNPGKDDWVAFCLDSEDDALSSFYFLVTPANKRAQGILDSDGNPLLPFAIAWRSATTVDKQGWIAEMAIPLRDLPRHGSARVRMSFKVARFISRSDEEDDFPEDNPDRGNLEQFHELILTNIKPSVVGDEEVFRRALEEKKQDRLQLRNLPPEQQLEKWGKASALDYLVFPSREFAPSDHPYHFQHSPEDQRVAELLDKMEYAPGRQIEDLQRFLVRSATTSLVVIKDDAILYERYFNGFHRDSIGTSFSVAKSFDSALVGIAIQDGKIDSVHDPITKYLPELQKRDPRFANITVKDLLQMSAGLRYNEDSPDHDDDVTYHSADLRKAALQSTSIVDPAGKYFLYNDYHPLLIGLILERTTGGSVSQYFQQKLWSRLQMEYSGSWSTDLEQPPFEKMLVGINARPIDFAKFGKLMLDDGKWGGQQVLPSSWVEEATQDENKPAGYYAQDADFFASGHYYKYFWWGDKRLSGKSDFHAAGNRGQCIYVSPQNRVVIVRTGFDYGIPMGRWVRLFSQLAEHL